MKDFYRDYAKKNTCIKNIRKWAMDATAEVVTREITIDHCEPNTLYITDTPDRVVKTYSKRTSYSYKSGFFGERTTSGTTTRYIVSDRVLAKFVDCDGRAYYADSRYGNGLAAVPRFSAEIEAKEHRERVAAAKIEDQHIRENINTFKTASKKQTIGAFVAVTLGTLSLGLIAHTPQILLPSALLTGGAASYTVVQGKKADRYRNFQRRLTTGATV